jgi:hypothetical protein
MACPACKIILDGGRFAAAARSVAGRTNIQSEVVVEATYLADIVLTTTNAVMHGIRSGALTPEQIDEAHAWSELQCHRAAQLEASRPLETFDNGRLLRRWATEDRLHATALAGGEYSGAWEVDGTSGIRKKQE